jgi:hypothetical protein
MTTLRFLLCLVLLAGLPITAAAEGIAEEQATELLSFDFSPALTDVGVDSSSMYAKYPGDDTSEKARLLNPLPGSETKLGPTGVAFEIANFHYRNGRLPVNALELRPELLTEEGYVAFLAMEPIERLEQYGDLVNRITGKFYSTFEPEWIAGGISASRRAPVGKVTLTKGKKVEHPATDPNIVWEYEYWVYGAQTDSIIWKDAVRMSNGTSKDSPSLQ